MKAINASGWANRSWWKEIYYVYLNERKEGVPGAGNRYRGLAVLRVEMSGHPALHGDYFTEQLGGGKLQLSRRRCYPWWTLWK
jgi:hypothetical protein